MNDKVNVLNLSWIDVYNEVIKGNISWEEFEQYLLRLEGKSHTNGWMEGVEDTISGVYGEPQ